MHCCLTKFCLFFFLILALGSIPAVVVESVLARIHVAAT